MGRKRNESQGVRTTPKRAEDLHTRKNAAMPARNGSTYRVDLHTLLHAHRAELPEHADALANIQRVASSGAPWGVTTTTAAAFLRTATHNDVLSSPTPSIDAVNYLHELLALPNCRLLDP